MSKKQTTSKNPPIGVKLISIWWYISAFFTALFGLIIMVVGSVGGSYLGDLIGAWAKLIAGLAVVGGIILIALGIVYLFIAINVWKGKSWARMVTLVFSAFAVVTSIFSLPVGIVGLAINGLIIWYLWYNKEGKGYFS